MGAARGGEGELGVRRDRSPAESPAELERAAVVLTFALGWLAAYLLASGAVLAVGGHWRLVALHTVLALGAVVILRSAATKDLLFPPSPNSRSFASLRMTQGDALRMTNVVLLAILLIWPLLYFEIPLLISALGSTYHDPLIQRWEEALFRGQPSQTLASSLPWRWLSELLHGGYLAYYPAIFAPTLFLLWRRQHHAATRLVVAVGVVYGLCWTIYAFLPVQGPRYLWPAPPDVPAGPARSLAAHLLRAGSSRGAAFPSSHMAVTTVQAVVAWPASRRLSIVLFIIALLVGGGAVYGGFHYAVDVVAGAVLSIAAGFIVLCSSRRANRASRLECR